MPQKGFSEAVEQKNKIRKVLKGMFKERDCVTLVRPTTDENLLQRLAEIGADQLRPEFVQQSLQLRKKVLDQMNLKVVNGRELNGPMLAGMVQAYTSSINQGSVPSIDSAWGFICHQQAERALKNSQEIYLQLLNEQIQNLPISDQKLKEFHFKAKNEALNVFFENSFGNSVLENSQKLRKRISQQFELVQRENEEVSQKVLVQFLNDNYEVIQRRLKNGEFSKLGEFQKELNKFQEFFNVHAPEGPSSELLLQKFCFKSLSQASDFLLKKFSNELSVNKELREQKLKFVQTELRQIKHSANLQKQDLQEQVKQVTTQKAQAVYKSEALQRQYEDMRRERDKIEEEFRAQTRKIKENSQKQSEDVSEKYWQFQEKIRELERSLQQAQSEKQQENALFQQKVNYIQQNLTEANAQISKLTLENKQVKTDYQKNIKEIISKYQQQIKVLQFKLVEEAEKYSVLEKSIVDQGNKLQIQNSQFREAEQLLKAKIDDLNDQIQANKLKLEKKDQFYKAEYEKLSQSNSVQIDRLRTKLEVTVLKLKESDTYSSTQQAQTQKQNAILKQKVQFLTLELEQTKSVLQNDRKHHLAMLNSINTASGEYSKQDLEMETQKLKTFYQQKLLTQDREHEQFKKSLASELQNANQAVDQLQLQVKLMQNQAEIKQKQYAFQIENLTTEKTRLFQSIKSLQSEKSQLSEQTEQKIKEKLKEYQREIQDLQIAHQSQVQTLNQNHQDVLSQLKNYYNQQKQRIQQRLKDQKERTNKKISLIYEQYEQKQREELESYEQQIQNLQQELNENQRSHQLELQSLKHQTALDSQKISTLQNYIQSHNQQLLSIQNAQSSALDNQLLAFQAQRNKLQEKIDFFSQELTVKQRKLTDNQYQLTQLRDQITDKEAELSDASDYYKLEKESLEAKLDTFKNTNFKLADELSQKKSEYNRELALARQEASFLQKKISQLEVHLADAQSRSPDALATCDPNLEQTLDYLKQEKISLEFRFEELKKQHKELQSRHTRQSLCFEKEKHSLFEKLSYLELKKHEIQISLNSEIEELQSQLTLQNSSQTPANRYIHSQNESLKQKISHLQKVNAQLTACQDRDKVLWENKFNFLSQQRDQARNDIIENQKKFDIALERLQKRGTMDKEKVESATSSLIASVEARYQSQIKDLQQTYQLNLQTLEQRAKDLEKANKSLKFQLEHSQKHPSTENSELRLQKLQQHEQSLLLEVQKLKHEKNLKIREANQAHTYEKEVFKTKLLQAEQRIKQIQHQKAQAYLKQEKQRAKWALQRDRLVCQKNEAQDLVDRLEKRKECLMRENEKMRRTRQSSIRREHPNNRSFLPSNLCEPSIDEKEYLESFTVLDSSPRLLKPANFPNLRSYSPLVADVRASTRKAPFDENKINQIGHTSKKVKLALRCQNF